MKKILITIFMLAKLSLSVNADNVSNIDMSFWEKFNDDALIENLIKVYEHNNDLKAAVIKVNEAQRIAKMSFANELPHIGFEGYIGQIFKSSDEIFGDIKIPDYTESHFLLPLTMNYEIDIWGQNHLKTKSKKKHLEMIRQDERAAYIYISSAFAADYFNLIRTDKLIECQEKLISLQEQVIDYYKIRYNLGTSTLSEIENAEKNLTFMQEDLDKLREKQDIFKNQLTVFLSDRAFDEISRKDFNSININLKIPENIDITLLDKRPDRIKSELDLERIGIDTKVAQRDFLPKFIITGNIGFNMYNISSPHKFLADLGVVPVMDIFSGGRKIQMLKFQKDRYEIAKQNYEKTILKSIQETNDALYSLKTANNIKNTVNKRVNNDIKELNYTKIKENAGTANNLDILLQEENLIISQKQDVSSKVNEIISYINLYQALGGIDFIQSMDL